MKKQVPYSVKKSAVTSFFIFLLIVGFQNYGYATSRILKDTIEYKEFRGSVTDSKTKKPLEFATLLVNGTNISTPIL